MKLLELIDNNKTYAAAALLAVIGVLFLFASGVATWGDPSGDYAKIVRQTIGSVAIMLAVAVAALRHSQAKLGAKLDKLLVELTGDRSSDD